MKELAFTIKSGFNTYDLVHSPDGWDDAMLEIERSTTMLGIVRSYSIQLKFMLDGAKILRDIFYNRIPDETSLTIKKLNRMTLQYENLFTGIFDFSTFVDTDYSVEVTILDNSLANYIKKNFDKEYTVEIVSNKSFYHWDNQQAIKPTQYMYFHELLYKVLDVVTEGKLALGIFSYDFNVIITSDEVKTVITNSVALQGGALSVITTSLKNILQSLFVLYRVVATIESIDNIQTFVLRSIESTFPEESSFLIENITDFKLTLAKDFIYDTLAIGHPIQEGDNVRVYEFGATSKFKNDSAFIMNKELDLVSRYRADVTGIEEYAEHYGTPDQTVNEIFVISIIYYQPDNIFRINTGSVYYKNGSYQGLPNVALSPRRLLLLNERFVNSCYYGISNSVFFTSAPFNISKIETVSHAPVGERMFEGSGYARSLGAFFIPFYFEFTAILPEEFTYNDVVYPFNYNALSIPALLRFKFQYENEWYEGFLMSMKLNVSGRKNKAMIKLLSTTDNNLSKLIR